ncbi:uncharacterized protein N7498_009967 [Penicillium cinerascens]|uniref:ABM domain-containing protein n=1 Tax=Penicillium cinerascens TaxID=70096 RepID=A0A9W9J6V1_9EURO|nr:uncharacterized protein N7498_009967 [Penicillium cinerascens]KAJ5190982.1 hypothetical protein N7498_009967 [Penicillium cinerascens]
MAITELIFPRVKTDQATLEELERDWPKLSKRLTDPNPGLLHASRGWVLTENGKDARDAFKEVLLFEWNEADSFHAFVGSEQFGAFAASIRHLVTGPPTLQLFETNESPKEAASAAVVEIIRVGVSNSKDTEASLQAWRKISHFLASKEGAQAHVTFGKSLNLEEEIFVGIIGWLNFDDRIRVSQEGEFVDALNTLKSFGDVSNITVGIDAMEL